MTLWPDNFPRLCLKIPYGKKKACKKPIRMVRQQDGSYKAFETDLTTHHNCQQPYYEEHNPLLEYLEEYYCMDCGSTNVKKRAKK